jgi:hypothetical protein
MGRQKCYACTKREKENTASFNFSVSPGSVSSYFSIFPTPSALQSLGKSYSLVKGEGSPCRSMIEDHFAYLERKNELLTPRMYSLSKYSNKLSIPQRLNFKKEEEWKKRICVP